MCACVCVHMLVRVRAHVSVRLCDRYLFLLSHSTSFIMLFLKWPKYKDLRESEKVWNINVSMVSDLGLDIIVDNKDVGTIFLNRWEIILGVRIKICEDLIISILKCTMSFKE